MVVDLFHMKVAASECRVWEYCNVWLEIVEDNQD